MNGYKKAGILLSLAIVGAGCSDFLSGPGLTENPNNATEGTAIQQLIAVQANMFTRMEGQMARSAGMFTQQIIGSNNQQLTWGTQYGASESDIPGHQSAFYTGAGLLGLRNIQAAATAANDPLLGGIAKVWEGFAFGTATSVWGDLPYSEALDPAILTPKLDPQQQIYAAVQTRLDEGIALLRTASTTGNCNPGAGDLIYCATAVTAALEVNRWIAAAYTLKARFYLHLVERQGNAAYTLALAAAQNGIAEAPTTTAQAQNGQAQLLAIASALAMRPRLLVLDEPTAQLDPEATDAVVAALQALGKSGTAVLIAEHRMDVLDALGARRVALEGGRFAPAGGAT